MSATILAGMTALAVLGGGGSMPLSQAMSHLSMKPLSAPTGPQDESKVPHYFGPYPNWANSPLTTSSAKVTVTGDGTGATATATIDPLTGGVSSVDVTDAGRGYTTATVQITGGDGNAAATAAISASGVVTGFTIAAAGHGYQAFDVAMTGGGGSGATAQGSGGVDAVVIADGGSGYTVPTVEFDLPDLPNGVQARGHVPTQATDGVDGLVDGVVTAIVIDDPGSGYLRPPGIAVHNGTVYDPIAGATFADASTTLKLVAIDPVDFGSGYTSSPTVTVTDPQGSGTGAEAAATTNIGAITAIEVTNSGAGYLTKGIKKFQDELPVPCDPASATGCPTAAGAKFLPVAVPDTTTYPDADTFEIALVQYRTRFSSDLPPTLTRGYVQLETPANQAISQHVELFNELLDGTKVSTGRFAVTTPQYLGPIIGATKDRAVRVVFRNLLPTGKDGDLFLPTDSSMMGSGMAPAGGVPAPADQGTVTDEVRNPACTQDPKPDMCFKDNRATLHLHGGLTPWISDGTPHQWITPTNENTPWPQGVSVGNVPDMNASGCTAADDGCQTFFYTNQQSARLMFYHDHSWGITRLNVYAGEAAGYTITDDVEKGLVASNTIPAAADTIPLIVQDRTFVPGKEQLAQQDPTWDAARWGGEGNFWYHHVYMPAQNPGDPSGMSAYGRWMYGPWFWPPATGTQHGPIDNPYYDPTCNLDDPATFTYQVEPFCEPQQIPGTPNISAGMEQFNDTPLVNGVAYPKITLEPKSYRLRLLNAANDRFFNLQWYTADAAQGDGTTEVKLNPAELAAAQNDPNVSPNPADANNNAAGPDWVQIGSEGGFLPAPTVVDGQQPTTWITDPTRFDVGNVDQHSMLLAPAERSDTVVDFSKYAGKTLILYNDAPAAFPARVASYDYYTGAPDLSPIGAPKILPGYGPNTRTVMQVTIAPATPAPAFDLTKLQNAFKHNVKGTGVFESGQHPIIVGQAAYNSAYGSSFAASGNCSVGTLQKCDGLVRINDTARLNFNTLRSPSTRVSMPLQPKAIHDEMNSTTFDEFGRMQANLGVEASPPTPGAQNAVLYPYVNPSTELIDGSGLPSTDKVTPIATMDDGTQIWRITHNGVDTHPIHFHLFDVQVLNRVTWDNIILKPDPNELGWKDTVRVAPLEDTIVALRPVLPKLPFEVPNAIRPLNPMEPTGSTANFHNVDVNGNPTNPIQNKLVNFGWEYVYHCHILSHEEMDMMRPVLLALPPTVPDGLAVSIDSTDKQVLTWNDNSITETSFLVQRSTDGTTWTDVGTSDSPLDQPNTHGQRSLVDPGADPLAPYSYRVVARNAVGYGGQFPQTTVQSTSAVLTTTAAPVPTDLTATVAAGPVVNLAWTDQNTTENGFVVERSTDNGATWTVIARPAALPGTGPGAYTDTMVTAGTSYRYRVGAVVPGGTAYSATATVTLVAAPTGLTARQVAGPAVDLGWTDNATNETGFVVQRSEDDGVTWVVAGNVAASAGTGPVGFSDTGVSAGRTYTYRVAAENGPDVAWSASASVPIVAPPSNLAATVLAVPTRVRLTWTDVAVNETGYRIERFTGGAWTQVGTTGPLAGGTGVFTNTGVVVGVTYTYRVAAVSGASVAPTAPIEVPVAVPLVPSGLTGNATPVTAAVQSVTGTWNDTANETRYSVQWSYDAATIAGTATTAQNVTTLTGNTLRRDVYIRVRASNALGNSAYSAWVLVPRA